MGTVAGWLLGWMLAAVLRYRQWVISCLSPRLPHGVHDAQFERWNSIRNTFGLFLVVLAHAQWRWPVGDYAMAFETWWESMLMNVILGALLVVVTAVAMPLFARRGHRVTMLRHMAVPLLTLLGFIAFTATLPVGALLLPDTGLALSAESSVVLASLLVVALLAYILGLWFGTPVAVRHFFRARDGHPALRAIIVIALSGWTLAVGLSSAISDGLDPRLPATVTIALLVAGPLINVGLSCWEVHRLRTRWGVQLREAR